jgi:hypothetical protein
VASAAPSPAAVADPVAPAQSKITAEAAHDLAQQATFTLQGLQHLDDDARAAWIGKLPGLEGPIVQHLAKALKDTKFEAAPLEKLVRMLPAGKAEMIVQAGMNGKAG